MNKRRHLLHFTSLLATGPMLAACASRSPGPAVAHWQAGTNSQSDMSGQADAERRADAARLMANASPQAIARALHLSNRLGYGPRPGDLEQILHQGEAAYIEQQLQPASIPLPQALVAELESLVTMRMPIGEKIAEYQAEIAAFVAAQLNRPNAATTLATPQTASSSPSLDIASASSTAPASTPPSSTPSSSTSQFSTSPVPTPRPTRGQLIREVSYDVSRNRLLRAIDSPRQLEEVMVEFWYNHFNVFIGKGLDRVLVGHYEQHAIRPHVFGRFRDLLGATAKHPAMLFYLDNAQSVADGFVPRGAATAPRGLNENYARELMELHTLGVDAGYTQKDVTELARILTGWSFDRRENTTNAFRFDERRHDRGIKMLLGHRIEPAGIAEGERALDLLAAHPATARHIAKKLAQYFVSDQPSKTLIAQLASRFTQSGGEIREVLRELFKSNEFWNLEQTKFKTPYQFVVSATRAAGVSLPRSVLPLVGALNQMGMPLYACPTPDGYPNTEAAWLNPEAMTRRLNFATALAERRLALNRDVDASNMPPLGNPQAISRVTDRSQAVNINRTPIASGLDWNELLKVLGPSIKASTRSLIESSPVELRAAMLLGSPEFMRK